MSNTTVVMELGNIMNLGLSRPQISDSLFKNKERAAKIKERMNRFIWGIINASNNIEIEIPSPENGNYFQYGFKIGPGNNSFVIRRLINERWWWSINDKQSSESQTAKKTVAEGNTYQPPANKTNKAAPGK